jgi:hypothetical protein
MVTGFEIDNQNLQKEQIKVLYALVGQLQRLNENLENMGKDREGYDDYEEGKEEQK